MTRLILIRHGESMANRQDVFSGHYDVELEEKGRIQAKCTADYVVNTYQVDKVYASDLKRAYETGKTVADLANVTIVSKEGLREIYGGDWEGVPFSDLPVLYPIEYGMWMKEIQNTCCPNGESIRELGQRIYATVEEIVKENEGKTVVIATHATPIRVLESMLREGDIEKMQTIPWVSNASVTELFYENGVWEYGEIGYDAHLEELRTALPEDI